MLRDLASRYGYADYDEYYGTMDYAPYPTPTISPFNDPYYIAGLGQDTNFDTIYKWACSYGCKCCFPISICLTFFDLPLFYETNIEGNTSWFFDVVPDFKNTNALMVRLSYCCMCLYGNFDCLACFWWRHRWKSESRLYAWPNHAF